ncbi:MAG: alcohol dehydrogenase catalytic domain-containing protein [Streptosporangiales bacterium]|nr:alcohol dehydrogenase catalytic domain-containing protein [Streptosporangiales bacterium]
MILALEYHRSPARYLAAGRLSAGPLAQVTPSLAPLRLVNRSEPRRAGPDWVRVRPVLSGICGSDLALLTGRASPYLGPLVSMPFVPGHEIVGQLMDDVEKDGVVLAAGSRVVLDPVLSCRARGLVPCVWCETGRTNRCDHITVGRVSAGLQTGFCADTGGGWSQLLVAHRGQLHPVPDDMPAERAVLAEPLACAVHSAHRAGVPRDASVVVVGAGTVGLLTVLALRALTPAGSVTVIAKHPHQGRKAYELGATDVLEPRRAARGLRRATGGSLHQPERGREFLLGGADIAFECTGGQGLDTAARLVRAGGRIVLSGMPSGPVDLTPVWYRELEIVGAYASAGDAREPASGADDDFGAALQLAADAPLDGFVDATYPLAEWREALGHALAAGRSGSVKVAFDPTKG